MPIHYTILADNGEALNRYAPNLPCSHAYKPSNPKIDIYVNAEYYGSTNWCKDLGAAMFRLLTKEALHIGDVVMITYAK